MGAASSPQSKGAELSAQVWNIVLSEGGGGNSAHLSCQCRYEESSSVDPSFLCPPSPSPAHLQLREMSEIKRDLDINLNTFLAEEAVGKDRAVDFQLTFKQVRGGERGGGTGQWTSSSPSSR